MNCLRCGEVCQCGPVSSSREVEPPTLDADESLAAADQCVPQEAGSAGRQSNDPQSPELVVSPASGREENGSAWRDELTAKLSSYRARRKPRPPRYPSLRLRFEADSARSASFNSTSLNITRNDGETAPLAAFETMSHQALALDSMTELPTRAEAEWEPGFQADSPHTASSQGGGSHARPHQDGGGVAPGSRSDHAAKIIEFPRSAEFARSELARAERAKSEWVRWEPAPPPSNELAGPVMAPPRILEAPEIVPPAPALGGITIEAAEPTGDQRRLGIDVPLQAASLARRVAAAALDGIIILVATSLFGLIFWKLTGLWPPRPQMLGLAAAVPCVLWAAYQYLLIVYAGTTPGLRLAGLQLSRFDGASANRHVRRWRVLAAYLGAVSLGMGYIWVFLDEDAMCWHDRITHTYLEPKKRKP